MKIIHTADLHLDSPIAGVKDSETRRRELLRALQNLSDFAENNNVAAIIVAGDLFDDQSATRMTVESVAQIVSASRAQWFVLRGNHGNAEPYKALQELCPQIKLFGERWTTCTLGNVAIVGRELGANDDEQWRSFSVDSSFYNVLVLHGDVDGDAYGKIDKKVIAQSAVKYVALGHRHAFSEHKFGRVRACYCGVLEARGFDERETTGFVLVDTEKDTIQFVPQCLRRVECLTLDVSAATTDLALEKIILDGIANASARNYLSVTFCGTLQDGVRLLPVANSLLQNRFFALRLKDETTAAFDFEKLKQEVSLRGEFVKLAMELKDETQRAEVLRLGLSALNGEV